VRTTRERTRRERTRRERTRRERMRRELMRRGREDKGETTRERGNRKNTGKGSVVDPNSYVFFFVFFKCLICDFSQNFSFYKSVRILIRTFFRFGFNTRHNLLDPFGFGSITLEKRNEDRKEE
jgi:hypothetical protein